MEREEETEERLVGRRRRRSRLRWRWWNRSENIAITIPLGHYRPSRLRFVAAPPLHMRQRTHLLCRCSVVPQMQRQMQMRMQWLSRADDIHITNGSYYTRGIRTHIRVPTLSYFRDTSRLILSIGYTHILLLITFGMETSDPPAALRVPGSTST